MSEFKITFSGRFFTIFVQKSIDFAIILSFFMIFFPTFSSNARGTDTTLGTATALASTGAPGGFFMSLYHGLRNYYMQNYENLVRGFMVGGLPYNPESRRKNIITENATKQNGTSVKSNEQRDREFEAMFASNGVAFDVARSPNSRVTEAVVSDPPIDSN